MKKFSFTFGAITIVLRKSKSSIYLPTFWLNESWLYDLCTKSMVKLDIFNDNLFCCCAYFVHGSFSSTMLVVIRMIAILCRKNGLTFGKNDNLKFIYINMKLFVFYRVCPKMSHFRRIVPLGVKWEGGGDASYHTKTRNFADLCWHDQKNVSTPCLHCPYCWTKLN